MFLSHILPIYNRFKKKSFEGDTLIFHDSKHLEDFYDLICKGLKKRRFYFQQESLKKVNIAKNNHVLLGFSGGKDSVATALRLKKQGYNSILVYFEGINPSLTQEKKFIENLSKDLDMPLITKSLKLGKSEWIEHPLKNIVMLAYLSDLCILSGVSNVSLGIVQEYTGEDHPPIDIEFSDWYDFLQAYHVFVKYYSNIDFVFPLKREGQAYIDFYFDDFTITDKCFSCKTPAYRFKQFREKVTKKFCLVLPETKCGLCYKCSLDYIMKTYLAKIKPNKEYLERCKDFLSKQHSIWYGNSNKSRKEKVLDFVEKENFIELGKRKRNYFEEPKAKIYVQNEILRKLNGFLF